MKIIVFIADDWGLSDGIHQAVASLHEHGAVDGAGIMMGQAFTARAVAYALEHPGLRTGLHLFASDRDCRPLTRSAWPLVWPRNGLVNLAVGFPPADRVLLAEVDAQLAAYRATGLPLHFVNSHFHFHARRLFFGRFLDRLRHHFPGFDGWIRLGQSRPMPGTVLERLKPFVDPLERLIYVRRWSGRSNDTLWGVDRGFTNQPEEIVDACRRLGEGFHEFFFHPGRSWNLNESGSDADALRRLAERLPASERHVSASD